MKVMFPSVTTTCCFHKRTLPRFYDRGELNGLYASKSRETSTKGTLSVENESWVMEARKGDSNICAHSTSSSPSSSSLSASSPWSSPVESPVTGHMQGAVPFSWEDEPGVPKQLINSSTARRSANSSKMSQHLLLRPPPLLYSKSPDNQQYRVINYSKKKGKRSNDDPFVAALVQCRKQSHRDGKDEFIRESDNKRGFHSNMLSWMSKACSVRDTQVILPRSAIPGKKLGRSGRTKGAESSDIHEDRIQLMNAQQWRNSPNGKQGLLYYAVPSSSKNAMMDQVLGDQKRSYTGLMGSWVKDLH